MIGQRLPGNLSHHHKTQDCKPGGRAVLLGSLTLLLSTRVPFPNKISCFVSTCVSSDNSFPSVRQEPSFGLWKGSPFLQQPGEPVSLPEGTDTAQLRSLLPCRILGHCFQIFWLFKYSQKDTFKVVFLFLLDLSVYYFQLRWVSVAAQSFSLGAVSGDYSLAMVHEHLIAVAFLVAECGL